MPLAFPYDPRGWGGTDHGVPVRVIPFEAAVLAGAASPLKVASANIRAGVLPLPREKSLIAILVRDDAVPMIRHGEQGDRILISCIDVDRRLESDLITGS